MLRGQPLLYVLLLNIISGVLWHCAVFFICISVQDTFFSHNKLLYKPHKWEKNGRFYSRVLRINRWKDSLPQHTGKGGFSKVHLDNVSTGYLESFITETCRGEWNHTLNCLFAVVIFVLNDIPVSLVLSFLLLLGNIPYIMIQRYNRFRLLRLYERIQRKSDSEHTSCRRAS